MSQVPARAIGINHVALEVGDVDEALAFYARLFDLRLRGRVGDMAFVELGDQFLALSGGGRRRPGGDGAHFGLVVDDKGAVRAALREAGVEASSGGRLDFRDPWGNLVEVVQYDEVQFTKAPEVLLGMGAGGLGKTEAALAELRAKGMA